MMFSEYLDFIQSNQGGPGTTPAASSAPPSAIIGASLPRIDGPLKTSGTAAYASDYNFPRMVYAVPVCSTIASGKIRSLDTSAADKMPGVLLVLHNGNMPPVYRNGSGGRISEGRPPFEDQTISYWGQYIAAVIAETFQQAQAAAAAVRGRLRLASGDRQSMRPLDVAYIAQFEHRVDSGIHFPQCPLQFRAPAHLLPLAHRLGQVLWSRQLALAGGTHDAERGVERQGQRRDIEYGLVEPGPGWRKHRVD